MQLKEIVFPVYKLGNKPEQDNGIIYYTKANKDGELYLQIVDDKSIEGSTLARRRLLIENKLFKLKLAIFFIGDLLKIVKPNMWFIDSMGKLFNYTKSRSVPLVCCEILEVHRVLGATVLELKGIPGRHMCLYPPTELQKYAGVLKLGAHTYILYGLYEQRFKETKRKV